MNSLLSDSGPAPADLIKDTDTQGFAADVIEASAEVPVIVDFWAPWCGPCKTLGPIIEKAVQDARGAVKLVKINVDDNQALAGQMGIRSIPAVYAFKDGRPVDGFTGALPESQIKDFIKRLTGDQGPSPVEQALEQAEALLADGQLEQAGGLYAQILQAEPENAEAMGGMAQIFVKMEDFERAREVLERVPAGGQDLPSVAGARAALELAEQASDLPDAAPLQARIEANPDDHEARIELATVLVAAGRREEAVEQLLESIQRNRNWNEEAARKQLLQLFEAFGPTDPLTSTARRRLSSILFS